MGFNDDYAKLRKKRQQDFGASAKEREAEKAAENLKLRASASAALKDDDIAPVKGTTKSDKRTFFQKGAFEDGYQLWDGVKTLYATGEDLVTDVQAGVIGMGEKAIDAGAYLVGGAAKLFGADEFADRTKDFIAKDLYDEEEVAKKWNSITSPASWINTLLNGNKTEEKSVFGDKTDAIAQSAGQLAGTVALQSVGLPWFVTTGVTSFGSETENAFNQGAGYLEAGGSGLISAGAEILTEKLSGGIKFGGQTLGDAVIQPLVNKISNKVVRTAVNLGLDALGEGGEEFISQIFSNLGSALYKEEDLTEILWSEEAFDEYLESFIGGAALGGGMGTVNAVNSIASGRDYKTGLTSNEQKVLDKEIENRTREAESDGKKLKREEKAKIKEEALSDLKKGYISTDTIESALGGKTYQAYQDAIANDEGAIRELETMFKGAELEQAIGGITKNSKQGELKAQTSKEVADLIKNSKDSYLSESYNEIERRKQTFTADTKKLKGKQLETIQKAIDSGVLNNTNRTHEFVDMVAKISADKGVSFDFTNNEKLAESGFAVEGKTVNGFVKDGTITTNIDSAKALNSVVGHEITHVLEGTELYAELKKVISNYAARKGEYRGRLEAAGELYKDIDGYKGKEGLEAIEREVVSDLVGDYLFTDADFVNKLTSKRNVFQKLWDEIKYLCKIAAPGSKEAKELAKVQHAFEKAYKTYKDGAAKTKAKTETATETADIRFSLSENVEETKDLMALHNLKSGELLKSLDLGGLPMPSIAVIKADAGHEQYGDVSLILPKEAIDPKANKANKVYGGDAWTPTYPKIEYKPNAAVEKRISGKYYDLADKYGYDAAKPLYRYTNELEDALNREGGEAALLESLYDSTDLMQAYLLDTGKGKVDTVQKEIRTELSDVEVDQHEFFINELGADVIDSVMAANGENPAVHKRQYWEQHGESIKETYKKLLTEKYEFTEQEVQNVFSGMKTYDFLKLVRDAYLYRKNGRVTVKTEADLSATAEAIKKAAGEGYKDWVDGLFKGIEEKSGIRNNAEYFTPSGNRRSWNALHWENTLENVVRAMRQQKQTGADALFAAHQIFATSAKEYKSIDAVKADSHRLRTISPEAYEEIKDSYASRFTEIANRIADKGERNQFIALDNAMECIVDAVRSSKTKAGIAKNLSQYTELTVTEKDVADIVSLVADISNMPTGYFEAKPQRAVGFDEIGVFVIPSNADAKLKQELLNKGYSIAEYNPDVEGDRKRVVNLFEQYKFSLSDAGETTNRQGRFNTYGEDVRLEAPEAESIAPTPEAVPETETVDKTVAPAPENSYDEGAPITADEADAMNDIDSQTDADAPPEMDAPIYGDEEVTAADPFEKRDIKEVGNRKVKAYMYENPEVKPFFQEEANVMLGELQRSTKGERFYNDELYYETNGEKGFFGTERETSGDIAYLLDELHYTYAQIEKGLKAIIEDNGAENNAVSKRIEFLLNDRLLKGTTDFITGEETPPNQDYIKLLNEKQIQEYSEEARKKFFKPADELAPMPEAKKDNAPVSREVFKKRADEVYGKIKDLSSGKYHKVDGYGFHLARGSKDAHATITINTPDGKKLQNKIPDGKYWENEKLWREAARMVAEKDFPNVEKITPEEAKKAQIIINDTETPKPKRSIITQARTHLLDKFSVFEDLALKTKNRELDAKANFMHYSEQRAQNFIANGADGVRGILDLKTEVEKSGLDQEFQEYMYDMLNTDRMSIEANAAEVIKRLGGKFEKLRPEQIHKIAAKKIGGKTSEKTAQTIRDAREYVKALEAKNLPVYGYEYTAEMSRASAAEAEANHPEFKKWAQEIYDNVKYLREQLVKDGEISKETADLWEKIYPHYVPVRRKGKDGNAISVPLDTNKTGVNAPIKRATGGDSDIGDLFKTLALRAEQTFKAGAKNSFGVELMHTLGTRIDQPQIKTNVDEIIDGVETANHESRLKKGENGMKPTFTVFENGERVEFEITEDMYDALKPTEGILARDIPGFSHIGKFQRNILTQYNPAFTATNAIKDVQDILMNSQHAAKTYANLPSAVWQLARKGKWYTEYMQNGGEQNTYFDSQDRIFKEENNRFKKIVGMPLRWIERANNFVERAPRLAEYMASRKKGASVEVAMLDAARVTTNFAAGGDVTKFANRNGATFLNASVQGFNQQVRNIREAKANGLKGWTQLAAKTALAGLPALLLNNLLWDDDEEYDELSDYVKENYYVVAKYGDGQFVRIPKGRTVAVIQNAFEQVANAATGDDEIDLGRFLELAISNLAPNNPIDNNILSPIIQTANNKTWYGEDLVPTRLQDLPDAEQYDESTDAFSKWLGENTNISPYKINYLLNQYGGGIADVFLPMGTPEAERGDDSFGGNLIAPLKDKFTTDGVMNNQNVTDFYSTVDELTKNANSVHATDEDILKYKYMNSVNAELGELYQQKREIQNRKIDEDFTHKDKYEQAREIQRQIDKMTKNGLNTYNDVKIDGGYATVGDVHFRWYEPSEDSDAEPGWQKISGKQLEKQEKVTNGLGISASEYWSNKEEYDYAYDYPEKYAVSKAVGGYEAYRTYSSELYDIKADKDASGKTINGSRKEKVLDYINNMDADYGTKIILFKSEYNADDTYNYDIIDYLNSREDISYEDMVTILKELGFTVHSNGRVTW